MAPASKRTEDPGARSYYTTQLNLPPRGGDQRSTHCPFHDDRTASLSVNLHTGLWTCHANCGSGNRAQFASRLAAGTSLSELPTRKLGPPELVCVYTYTDARGKVTFRKRRLNHADGKKTFRCEASVGQGWATDLKPLTNQATFIPPLYNLPALFKPSVTTLVKAEGEKDVDNLK